MRTGRSIIIYCFNTKTLMIVYTFWHERPKTRKKDFSLLVPHAAAGVCESLSHAAAARLGYQRTTRTTSWRRPTISVVSLRAAAVTESPRFLSS